jgi:Zinc carboxypeptidase
MRLLAVVAAAAALFVFAAPAMAAPVATDDSSYQALGRVFPDPLANCQNSGGACSPTANGNVPATQFIGIQEFMDAITYMNQKPEWQRYMEILTLDGKLGDGAGNGKNPDIPGNNLDPEFAPDASFVSAGLPTSDLGRKKSDLMVVRVTDESVPDAGKKRYTLSLSIHGIERAGAEGGTRAMEDIVTSGTTGLTDKPIVPEAVRKSAPTFQDVLKKTIIYFTYPNPDGWRRGSVSSGPEGGVFFQRYNGNGVDPNRDWPDIGYAFRGYSAVSEPETKAWISFYNDVRKNGGEFAAGDDLHGQPEADALSFTLLPHGRHRYDKNVRIQETAKAINRSTYDRIKWSPIVQDNDQPHGGGAPCVPGALGDTCAKIYAQTWGSVYDTINYTTTGALGDWFDSKIGLNADGIDNEMSFSHLDKNITFEPQTEQLHVDGNKALIYAHLTNILQPQYDSSFDVGGRKGYVPNKRVKADASLSQPIAPEGSVPQDDDDAGGPQPVVGSANFDFPVKRGPQTDGKNIFSGGMRVEATNANAQGIGTGMVTLQVQCKNCDEHPGVKDSEDYVTVAEDFNQSPLYAQAGVVATVNHPQAYGRDGKPVLWRAVIGGPAGVTQVKVHFTQGRASEDGDTGGGAPPEQRAYDVANTDFFEDLNPFIPGKAQDLQPVQPRDVIDGKQSLGDYDTIALADDPLPGYVGPYRGASEGPTGPPTADFTFESSGSAPGGGSGAPGTTEEKPFTIGPNDGDKSATITISWTDGTNDFDLYVYKVGPDGARTVVGSSAGGPPASSEEVVLPEPKPGDYVIEVVNYAAPDPTWTGTAKFEALPAKAATTSDFTEAEKNTWFAKLSDWVKGGGNLVLTDGALRALPELTSVPGTGISKQVVYAGQSAFSTGEGDTLKDPLARNVAQQGARFNAGMRRQMFEPTPLGYAIQDTAGADQSNARQYDVDRVEWEKAGGRTVATSADAGARDAAAVNSRVTIGEAALGKGDIRIAGALLPQPTENFDHEFGLEPYATTYTGYVIARNLLEALNRSSSPALKGTIGGRFVISRRAVKLRKGVARVRVSCRTPLGCKGTLRLAVRVKVAKAKGAVNDKKRARTKLLRIGKKKFSFATKRRNAILRVKITKRGRRIVKRQKRRIRVHASAPIKFTDGLKGTAKRSLWLYRPSHVKLRR